MRNVNRMEKPSMAPIPSCSGCYCPTSQLSQQQRIAQTLVFGSRRYSAGFATFCTDQLLQLAAAFSQLGTKCRSVLGRLEGQLVRVLAPFQDDLAFMLDGFAANVAMIPANRMAQAVNSRPSFAVATLNGSTGFPAVSLGGLHIHASIPINLLHDIDRRIVLVYQGVTKTAPDLVGK